MPLLFVKELQIHWICHQYINSQSLSRFLTPIRQKARCDTGNHVPCLSLCSKGFELFLLQLLFRHYLCCKVGGKVRGKGALRRTATTTEAAEWAQQNLQAKRAGSNAECVSVS